MLVRLVLEAPDLVGHRRVSLGPRDERVHPGDGHRDLLAQHREHVGSVGQEPAARRHAIHLQTTSVAPASTAVAGMVVTQASSISRTILQRT